MIPYDASRHIPINKSFGIANGLPLLAKSYFQDYENYTQRPYNSREEACEFLPKPADRKGGFTLFIKDQNGIDQRYCWKESDLSDEGLIPEIVGAVSAPGGLSRLEPYKFAAVDLTDETTIPLPEYWTHTEGDQYDVYVAGFYQTDFIVQNNSIVLDEAIPTSFTGAIIKYPNS